MEIRKATAGPSTAHPSDEDLLAHFGEVDLGVVEIVLRVLEDEGAIGVAEFAAEFAGDSSPEGAGRDDGVFGQDGAGGDDGALADAAIVEDGDAHADENRVF